MGENQTPTGADELLRQDPQQSAGTSPFRQQYPQAQGPFASQLDMAQHPGNNRSGAFSMASVAGSLPPINNYRTGGYPPGPQQQRYSPSTSSPPAMPQMASQYPQQPAMHMASQPYYMTPHPPGQQQYYGSPLSPSQQAGRPNMGFYQNQMMMGQQHQNHVAPGYYYPQPGAAYTHHSHPMQHSMAPGQFYQPGATGDPRALAQPMMGDQYPAGQKESVPDGQSGVVRGPPRKPRQSGHAIWIGNLPPQTNLMSLVHHVCKEAGGLESLFLISKSNCAFANFKTEEVCAAAQQKLHDSKFQSVRLVSRLRKSTVEGASGVTAPTGPAAAASSPSSPVDTPTDSSGPEESSKETQSKESQDVADHDPQPAPATNGDASAASSKDKFFILKSLTVEDLELSVRTGIWATQSHNEESLNAAFNAVDNVYLVFSANKSGEYFGYARMVSRINEDPEAAIKFAPKAQTATEVDLPKAIPTKETEFAPKGRIIDDSARGTIFWEADRGDADGPAEDQDRKESDSSSGKDAEADDATAKAWGKPFKLEWLSTTRLPFYRTRGLRNPWNSHREVKIARDGTELETLVGRRLIGLFNRVQSPATGAVPVAATMRPGMMMPGYPPMRPGY